jgi:hypothetical protein
MATETVIVNCARIEKPALDAIDRIARATLAARRRGREVWLSNASDALLELLCFAGLDGTLRVEVKRQPEQRKEPGGVEEEGELPDPAA